MYAVEANVSARFYLSQLILWNNAPIIHGKVTAIHYCLVFRVLIRCSSYLLHLHGRKQPRLSLANPKGHALLQKGDLRHDGVVGRG